MLEVQAEEFWRGLRPLDLQEGLPLLRDTVYVIGYMVRRVDQHKGKVTIVNSE